MEFAYLHMEDGYEISYKLVTSADAKRKMAVVRPDYSQPLPD
jgi:hypothetical protein